MLKSISSFICKYADILIFSLIGFVLTCVTTLDLLFPETVFFKCLFFIAAALLLQHLLPRPFIGKILTVPLLVGSLYNISDPDHRLQDGTNSDLPPRRLFRHVPDPAAGQSSGACGR